jgi:hypothetical protein
MPRHGYKAHAEGATILTTHAKFKRKTARNRHETADTSGCPSAAYIGFVIVTAFGQGPIKIGGQARIGAFFLIERGS